MRQIKTKLNQATNRVLSYFPTKLPVGMAEFDTWANTIISLLGPGLEKIPADDIKFVLTTNLQRLGPDEHKRSMQYYVRVIRSAAVKQISAQVFQDVKLRQAEAQAAKKLAEDTAKQETLTTSGQETNN